MLNFLLDKLEVSSLSSMYRLLIISIVTNIFVLNQLVFLFITYIFNFIAKKICF